jgi:hypothetical protein
MSEINSDKARFKRKQRIQGHVRQREMSGSLLKQSAAAKSKEKLA